MSAESSNEIQTQILSETGRRCLAAASVLWRGGEWSAVWLDACFQLALMLIFCISDIFITLLIICHFLHQNQFIVELQL